MPCNEHIFYPTNADHPLGPWQCCLCYLRVPAQLVGGLQPSRQKVIGRHRFVTSVDLCEDNLSLERKDMFTGSSCSGSMLPQVSNKRKVSVVDPTTLNLPDPKRHLTTSGKKTQPQQTPASNQASLQCNAPARQIGNQYAARLRTTSQTPSRQTSTSAVTTNFDPLPLPTLSQQALNERSMSIGDPLVLESHDLLGNQLLQMPIQRTQGASFGTVINLSETLSQMNFEVLQILAIYCAGSIAIRYQLRSKDQVLYWLLNVFG